MGITQEVACLQEDYSGGKALYALLFKYQIFIQQIPYVADCPMIFLVFCIHTLWFFSDDKGNIKLMIDFSNQVKLKKK